jgi:hypothetical protein
MSEGRWKDCRPPCNRAGGNDILSGKWSCFGNPGLPGGRQRKNSAEAEKDGLASNKLFATNATVFSMNKNENELRLREDAATSQNPRSNKHMASSEVTVKFQPESRGLVILR